MTDEHNSNDTANDDIFIAEADEFDDDLDAKLPVWPKVIGIISVILGSIGVLCKVVLTAMAPLQISTYKMKFTDGLPPELTQVNPMLIVVSVIGVLTSVALLVAGIMLLLRKYNARIIHLGYAIIGISVLVWSASIQLDAINNVETWINDNPNASFSGSREAMMSTGTIAMASMFGTSLIFLIWPVFCLVWFGAIKKTHEDMTGGVDLDVI